MVLVEAIYQQQQHPNGWYCQVKVSSYALETRGLDEYDTPVSESA
jgi:hypothetical protein